MPEHNNNIKKLFWGVSNNFLRLSEVLPRGITLTTGVNLEQKMAAFYVCFWFLFVCFPRFLLAIDMISGVAAPTPGPGFVYPYCHVQNLLMKCNSDEM